MSGSAYRRLNCLKWVGVALCSLALTTTAPANSSRHVHRPCFEEYRSVSLRGEDRATTGTPEVVARNFLDQHTQDLNLAMERDCWHVAESRRSRASVTVDFVREVGGLPVYGERLRVVVDPRGEIRRVVGTVAAPATQFVNAIRLSSVEAQRIAESAWQLRKRIPGGPPPRQMAYPDPGGWKIVWVVSIPSADPVGDGQVLIDAGTGEVIKVYDLAMHFSVAAADTNRAEAYVFLPDPLTAAHASYGDTGFVDNNDDDSPQLDSQRFLVTLQGLTQASGQLQLTGTYVSIQDVLGVLAPPASVAVGDSFLFNRSESGFEDVMAYYHIDAYQRRIQALGFTDLQNGPIVVDAHASADTITNDYYDNSWYAPSVNSLYFGEGGVDDAEDADVLIHEYGHALQYDAMFHTSTVPQQATLGWDMACLAEGYSDYLAASYSRKLETFGSDRVYNWDGNNPLIGWYGRSMQTTDIYPDNWATETAQTDSRYANGTIWADALWRIQGALGPDTTDAIALESFYTLTADIDPRTAAEYLVDAAEYLFPGNALVKVHVENALVDKGFLPAVSVPNHGVRVFPERFSVDTPYPNPFNPSVSLNLHLPTRADVTLRIWNLSGQLLDQRSLGSLPPGDRKLLWQAKQGMASGVILLEFDAGVAGRVVRKAVLLR